MVIDAQTIPSIDLTAVGMLDQLAEELAHDGVRLAIARDVGQVRDVIAHAPGDSAAGRPDRLQTYRSLREAIEAVRPSAPEEGA